MEGTRVVEGGTVALEGALWVDTCRKSDLYLCIN